MKYLNVQEKIYTMIYLIQEVKTLQNYFISNINFRIKKEKIIY